MHVHTSDQERLSMGFGGYTCNWGVHMCALYDSDAERDEFVYGFLHQGDVDGDLVRLYHDAPTADGFKREYARRYPAEASHPEDGSRFTLVTSEQRCFPNGRFDPLAQDPKLRALRDTAIGENRRIRGIGEMEWAARGVPGVEYLLPYEARLNKLFDGAPILIACTYDLRKHPGSTIMGVLRTHRFTIMRGMIVENPYYDPQRILSEHGLGWPPLV
jgi:hypothetical protein